MKVLITGSSSALAREIVLTNHTLPYEFVTIGRNKGNLPKNVKQRIVDYRDDQSLQVIFNEEKPEIVIHLAAITGSDCEINPEYTRAVNVDLTQRLADMSSAYGVKKFIFTSTAAVYQQVELEPIKESADVSPTSVYGKTKLEAEMLLKKISKSSNTQFITLRIFNIYGRGFHNSLINRLLISNKESSVELVGYEHFFRDYIHVNDVVSAVFQSIESELYDGFSVFNISSGTSLSNKKLLDCMHENGIEPHYSIIGDQVSYSWGDITEAISRINFNPRKELLLGDFNHKVHHSIRKHSSSINNETKGL